MFDKEELSSVGRRWWLVVVESICSHSVEFHNRTTGVSLQKYCTQAIPNNAMRSTPAMYSHTMHRPHGIPACRHP